MSNIYILLVVLLYSFPLIICSADFQTENELTMDAVRELALINSRLNVDDTEARQFGLNFGNFSGRIPCQCAKGLCKCCTGSGLSAIGLSGCMEIVYVPEDFSFEVKMRMNDLVLYRNRVSGKNPPPMCFTPPRYKLTRACITFYDVYFLGKNMHVCMEIGGYFQGYEIFSRSYDCLLFGNKGIKIVKPEQGYPIRPTDVDIEDDDEEIEDYDENVVRNAKSQISII